MGPWNHAKHFHSKMFLFWQFQEKQHKYAQYSKVFISVVGDWTHKHLTKMLGCYFLWGKIFGDGVYKILSRFMFRFHNHTYLLGAKSTPLQKKFFFDCVIRGLNI